MIVIVIVCHIQVIINYIQDVNRTTSLFIMLDEFNCMLFLDVKSVRCGEAVSLLISLNFSFF